MSNSVTGEDDRSAETDEGEELYKVVMYWRWDHGVRSIDCFWCVRWPKLSTNDFGLLCDAHRATYILQNGSDEGYDKRDTNVLIDLGYKDAAQLLIDLPTADLRARFNQMEKAIYNSSVPLTREQAERILNERKS